MDNQQDKGMVVIPAYQEGVDPQDAINDTFVLVIHVLNLRKKGGVFKKIFADIVNVVTFANAVRLI